MTEHEHDVFLACAEEDREFGRALVEALELRGLKVWFDARDLMVGDSLAQSHDRGLARTAFGVLIVSPAFLTTRWSQRDYRGLAAIDRHGRRKVILPVRHNVTQQEVAAESPPLADLVAADSSRGVERVADDLARAIETERGSPVRERMPASHVDRQTETIARQPRFHLRRGTFYLVLGLLAGFDVALVAYLVMR